MIYIGNHISTSRGYAAMETHERELGGNTFAFFTRNPRGGTTKDVPGQDIAALNTALVHDHFGPLVAHAPYTMNLCSGKQDIREWSEGVFREDLAKMEKIPGNYFNFHPGSHTTLERQEAITIITDVLNRTVQPEQTTMVLLETMAGKGTEIGSSFEELKTILDGLRPEISSHVGVCLDTCHVWDAGYDIVYNLDGVLEYFDKVIGLDRLRAVHLNDSRNSCGSHKDRHEKLGEGMIGMEAIRRIVQHPALQGRPFILETPNEDDGYRKEIALVKSLMV